MKINKIKLSRVAQGRSMLNEYTLSIIDNGRVDFSMNGVLYSVQNQQSAFQKLEELLIEMNIDQMSSNFETNERDSSLSILEILFYDGHTKTIREDISTYYSVSSADEIHKLILVYSDLGVLPQEKIEPAFKLCRFNNEFDIQLNAEKFISDALTKL